MAEVLYRKWRPRSFGDLAGQEPVSRTLRNAVGQDALAHAYLLCGPRGTGKTSTGRILAKAANCAAPADGEPCGECASCRAFDEGANLDLVEIDAASNRGIDEIRALREAAAFHPTGKRKVYLIDEVHMLTEPAFNALLKTLEEPPPHVIFILATTEPHRVPATILSRCQRYNFRRIPMGAVADRLRQIAAAERISIDQPALETLARASTGSLRDAINLLEQAVAYHGRDLTADHVRDALGLSGDARAAEAARAALGRDLAAGLGTIASVRDDGADLRQFTNEVIQYLRSLLLIRAEAVVELPFSAEQLSDMRDAVAGIDSADIVRALRAFGATDFRADPLSSLPLELAMAECVLATERPAPAAAVAPAPAPRAAPAAATERRAPAPPAADRRPAPPRPRPEASRGPELRPVPPFEDDAASVAPGPPPEQRQPPPPVDDDASPVVRQARERWQELFNLTRTVDKRAGALLNSTCDIIDIDEEAARITFGFRYTTHADRAATGDDGANLRALTQAVQQIFGKPYTVICRHEPNVIDRQRAASAPRAPLVREALDLGARIVGER